MQSARLLQIYAYAKNALKIAIINAALCVKLMV